MSNTEQLHTKFSCRIYCDHLHRIDGTLPHCIASLWLDEIDYPVQRVGLND